MSATTLRDLSRAYAAGALDRETYRRQRHELLSRIVAGELPVGAFQPPEPEQRTVFPYEDEDGDTTQEILAPQLAALMAAKTPRWRSPWLVVVLAILGIAAAGFGLHLLWPPAPDAAPLAGPANDTPPPVAPSESDPLQTFLSANQWNAVTVERLDAAWQQLDQAARERLHATPAMRQLLDKTLEQIQAENALLALGDDEEALSAERRLLDLMDTLGVRDERLQRAREGWQTGQAESERQRGAAAALAASVAPAGTKVVTPDTPAPPPAADTALPAAAVPANLDSHATVIPTAAPPAPAPVVTPAVAPATKTTPVATVNAAVSPAVKTARTTCNATLAKSRRPYCQDALAGVGKGPALVVLPAGQFEMGGDSAQEQPRHTVRFERAFALGMFEVSAAEFAQFCKTSHNSCPAQPWDNPALPVVNVSWALATAYTQWLSQSSGAEYRLPSEAEWEYAARAGSTTPYPFGRELVPTNAHYSFKNALSAPLAAKDRSINHNDFKLYHMLGNVREWVQDAWNANYANAPDDGRAQAGGDGRHVVRGGSYADRAAALLSAARLPLAAEGDAFTGFRVLRVIE